MCHTYNKKRKIIHDGRNRTTKSRKDQNTWRRVNLQILGNIGSGPRETWRDEKKEHIRKTRKLLESKQHWRNFSKGRNTWAVPLIRRTLTNGPENKKTHDEAKGLTQRLYVSRKEGRRGRNSIQDGVDESIRFKDYINKREGNNTDNKHIKKTEITRKQN